VRPQANGSLTGRIGFVTGPRGHTLIYAKAGAAWLEQQTDITTNFSGFTASPAATSFDGVRWGWTIGAGVEAQLFGNWTGKVEYLHMDFGSIATYPVVVPGTPLTPAFNTRISDNIFRAGVNYKFDRGGPIFAKY